MKLLALETSTEACSVALNIDNNIQEIFEIAPREHTKRILPMIDQLMATAELTPQQLDGIAFSCGPGSFTGIRIATGITHGIALGADLPVIPISTLAALAQQFFNHNPETLAFTGMDARMQEIFWGIYAKNSNGLAELIGQESVTPASKISIPQGLGVGIGSAWNLYQQTLTAKLKPWLQRYDADYLPHAREISQLGANALQQGKTVTVADAQPVYLRNKVAKKASER